MAVRHPEVKRHVIENTGNGPEVMEQLRRGQSDWALSDDIAGPLGITDSERPKVEAIMRRGLGGLIPENPKGDKVARVRAQSPLIEAGNVHLIERDWSVSLVNEAAAFPNGAHDDQVDAMSQALRRLAKGPAVATAPSGTLSKVRPARAAGGVARAGGGARALSPKGSVRGRPTRRS
jgi:hypothetical protein